MAALTANGVGTCGADDNQAQAGHLITYAPEVAATLSRGTAATEGVSPPGADSTSEDGTGRGTPGVAFHVTQDPISGDVSPAMGAGCATIGVAYPLAVRGRDGGADLEAGEPGDPMFALRAGDGGSSRSQLVATETDQMIVRRLTPLECERLQGFPDNWTEGQSDSARYKQMGNSVAVPVFTWVLRRLEAVA